MVGSVFFIEVAFVREGFCQEACMRENAHGNLVYIAQILDVSENPCWRRCGAVWKEESES